MDGKSVIPPWIGPADESVSLLSMSTRLNFSVRLENLPTFLLVYGSEYA